MLKVTKLYLMSSLLTFLTQGFTQRLASGQDILALTSEPNNHLCDQFPQSSQSLSEFQFNNPQLSEIKRLNQEIEQLYDEGLYAKAIPLAERILSIYRDNRSENTFDFSITLNRLANLNTQINNIRNAEILLKEAFVIRESIYGDNHPAVAQIINNLAENYRRQKNYDKAEKSYKRALSIYQSNCGENHILFIKTLNNLGLLYIHQRQFKKAQQVLRKALEIYQKNYQNASLSNDLFVSHIKNHILNNLATLYSMDQNQNQAISFFMKIIGNYEQQRRNEHPEVAIVLNNLAFAQLAQGNVDLALTSLERGLDIEERHLSLTLTIGSERQKQEYMNTLRNTTYRSISLHLQNAPDSQEAANLAFKTILRRKGRILDVMTDSISILRQNLASEEKALFAQLEEKRKQLAMVRFNQIQPSNPVEIKMLEAEEKQLEAELLQRSAEFRAEAKPIDIAITNEM